MWRGTAVSMPFSDIEGWLSPREAFEACLWDNPVWLQEDLDEWRTTLALAEVDDDPARVFQFQGGINVRDCPEGNDWLEWGRWVEQRYVEVLEHPETLHGELAGIGDVPWRLGDPTIPTPIVSPVEHATTRWPTAAHGFAEYYGPHTHPEMDPRWAQDLMLRSGNDAWRSGLALECEDLLLLEDETLRATVVALGSVLVPPAFRLRLWLEWMAWSIRSFDWS